MSERPENPQRGNPHQLTVRQHVFPRASIVRFLGGGRIDVIDFKRGLTRRAGPDDDIEQIRARAQPALGDQQMPGAGNRQELCDALDDAEQQGGEQVVHSNPRSGEVRHCCRFVGAA